MQHPDLLLDADGLRRYQAMREAAIEAVSARFYEGAGTGLGEFGPRGREACREDLAFHLDFLRPVLEFGMAQPMVDYLCWLDSVLSARGIPSRHLPQSLEWLSGFFRQRMGGADGEIVANALDEACELFLEARSGRRPAATAPGPAPGAQLPWERIEPFERALLAGDRHGAKALMDACLAQGGSLVDFETNVIQPALVEIGSKWQANKVSVAQEHLATAMSQSLMAQGLLQSTLPPHNGRRVVLACVEGNHHCVGLQMVGDAMQLAGWEVHFLGANVPTRSLVAHVGAIRPDLLGLSVSFAHQFRAVRDVMSQLAAALSTQRPAVMLGGIAINLFDPLAGKLGADAWSRDAPAAVLQAARLAPARASA